VIAVRTVTYCEVEVAARRVATRWAAKVNRLNEAEQLTDVFGVPRGGLVPAAIVAGLLELPLTDCPGPMTLVVDDLVDSGHTAETYVNHMFDALFRKSWSPDCYGNAQHLTDAWLVFPWEAAVGELAPTDAVVRLLQHIGEDPTRNGLVDTPARVVSALTELTEGYHLNAADILATTFDEVCDEMVVVRDVPFTSLCEHHMLPFTGHVTVGYIPTEGGGVVGLSKLARLVDVHARRLQIQERMTAAIANDINLHLAPLGVGVVVKATHSCMAVRGVRKAGEMVTSSLLGVMREDPRARSEFLALT
jgi:GTP cyclohydrolase I